MEITNGRKSTLRKVRKRKIVKGKRKQRKNLKNFVNVTTKESYKRSWRGKEKTWARTYSKILINDGSKSKRGINSYERIRNSKNKRESAIRRNE